MEYSFPLLSNPVFTYSLFFDFRDSDIYLQPPSKDGQQLRILSRVITYLYLFTIIV